MSLKRKLVEISFSERMNKLEQLSKGVVIEGDFEGSVTGHWAKLDKYGAGVVSYKNKQYATKPIGFTSLPAGSEVELSHANGIYYSKF